jgi:hypothetical protein
MRKLVLSLGLSVAVLIPTSGNAQVYLLPAEPPQVTAASASWQINGEPVFYAGDYYYPAGPTVFFDGNVMVRSGRYRGVPLYADSTLQPYSVIYVPVGGKLMRPYERKRTGELAGTVGSRRSSFPTPPASSVAIEEPVPLPEPERTIAQAERPVGTVGSIVPKSARSTLAAPVERRSAGTAIESIPGPRSNAGVWIEYNGARWFAAGPAVAYSAERFTPVGEYRGVIVYRDSTKPGQIYVPSVKDGPLAPYRQ